MVDEVVTDAPTTEETPVVDTPVTDAPTSTEPTATEPAGSDKPVTDTPATEGVKYEDFKLPEDVELDNVTLEKAAPIFKELGLSKEQAQSLVSFYADKMQDAHKQQIEQFQNTLDEWKTQSQNDKEFGGEKFNENVAVAQAAMTKFGTPELKKLMDDTGVGNHPEIIRFMYKVGKLVVEDVPGNSNPAMSKKQDVISMLYPNARKE